MPTSIENFSYPQSLMPHYVFVRRRAILQEGEAKIVLSHFAMCIQHYSALTLTVVHETVLRWQSTAITHSTLKLEMGMKAALKAASWLVERID